MSNMEGQLVIKAMVTLDTLFSLLDVFSIYGHQI